MKKHSEEIINKAGRSTYPTGKSVLRTEATRLLGLLALAGFSVSLLGIREALLINGLLTIAVQVLIGRNWSPKTMAADG